MNRRAQSHLKRVGQTLSSKSLGGVAVRGILIILGLI
jgi:hypothetical protein